jgi:ribonuclease HII
VPGGVMGRAGQSLRRSRWTTLERDLRRAGGDMIAGVDEVGRGSLAGPVVACAIIMPPHARALRGVDDSKALPAAERRRLSRLILERAVAVGLGAASVAEIDRLNIYHASTLAMRRALGRLTISPDHVLVDGRPIRTLGRAHIAVVHGDDRCFSIACASIVAKVTRDRLMTSLAGRHPPYSWERNAGYATRAHIEALREFGTCCHHRRSFLVKALSDVVSARDILPTHDVVPARGEPGPLDPSVLSRYVMGVAELPASISKNVDA